MFKKIFSFGVNESQPLFLQQKVKISNTLSFFTLIIAIFYTIFSILVYPELTFIPVIGIFVCLAVPLLNSLGLNYLSRFMIGLLPIVLAGSYNAYIAKGADGPIIGLYMLQFAFALLPFLVFDLRERIYLIPLNIVCLIIILFFRYFNNMLEVEVDDSILRQPVMEFVSVGLACILGFASLYVLSGINKSSQENTDKLISEMDERNSFLKKSEDDLKNYVEKVKEAQEQEKLRNWATEGIALFSSMLRSASGTELYDKVIAQLVKYIEANQGTMFIVNETAGEYHIDLVSCYAYDKKKFIDKRILPGQGLIGQAFLEKSHIHLKKVPENYIQITSGLGEALPSSVLIMPLKVNESVEGLFEIASFQPFEPHVIEFIEKLGENIAAAISSDRLNIKTKELLEEARETTQKLQAQEEEMRQNVEELAATQEEMQRKEKEYILRIKELEKEVGQINGNARI